MKQGAPRIKWGGVSVLLLQELLSCPTYLRKLIVQKFPSWGLASHGGKKKGGDHNIFKRLDRAVASISGPTQFPQAKLHHHSFTSSDHCCISLAFSKLLHLKAPPFRFEKMWCFRQDYDSVVKKSWCVRFEGSHMFRLVNKCKLLKAMSKIWNHTQFGNIFRQLRNLDRKLADIEAALL